MMNQTKNKRLTFEELLAKDYVNEEWVSELRTAVTMLSSPFPNSHIAAFAHALREDEAYFDHQGDLVSPHGTPPMSVHTPRIQKISALSDFAPINLRVRRRKKKGKDQGRSDILFLLLRWPLLAFISVFIMAEFGLYVLIRQMVNTKEWITAWRGKKGALRKRLRASRTYEEWKDAAKVLDNHLQFDEWKKVDEDPYYDWKLVKNSLRALREKSDARGCLGVLETCIRANFAAVESSR
ncbi:hypothetical protein D9611_002487 [Ephemerocybe angulata]|uniref:Triacylglycerol lipase N-terminal domain-containing protein n=1 Tax=Ephemerocybe angulata TaxID=980116 RepID=A0A8H5C1L8_9AGAR|nr:hypothetical protein D9611_002487 [Tulosesus angulatus]